MCGAPSPAVRCPVPPDTVTQWRHSGKTTLAVHTAVAADEAGERVVLIDTDPQKSATVWGDAREAASPIIATAGVSELARVLAAAKEEGIQIAIVDAAPHAAPEASKIARASDLVVIPCRPSAFDLAAAEGAVRIVTAAGAKAVFVLSACPFRAPEIPALLSPSLSGSRSVRYRSDAMLSAASFILMLKRPEVRRRNLLEPTAGLRLCPIA